MTDDAAQDHRHAVQAQTVTFVGNGQAGWLAYLTHPDRWDALIPGLRRDATLGHAYVLHLCPPGAAL